MDWLYPMIRDISIGVGGLVLIRLLSQQKRNLEGQVSALVKSQHALLMEATALKERADRLFLFLDHDAVASCGEPPRDPRKARERRCGVEHNWVPVQSGPPLRQSETATE